VLDWRVTTWHASWPSTNDFSQLRNFGAAGRWKATHTVEPAGTIGSVGFVFAGAYQSCRGLLAEEQMLKLRISDSRPPPNVVLGTCFTLIIAAQRASKADLSHRACQAFPAS